MEGRFFDCDRLRDPYRIGMMGRWDPGLETLGWVA